MINKPGAIVPHNPYNYPVPVPKTGAVVIDPAIDSQSLYSISDQWIAFVIGCVKTLTADSSWKSSTLADVELAVQYACNVLNQLSTPIMLAFRIKPTDACIVQFSQDNSVTWHDMPTVDPSCFAGPVLAGLAFRNNPADHAAFQYTIDGGTTWSTIADWIGPYIKTLVDGTHTNFISATGGAGLNILMGDDNNGLVINQSTSGIGAALLMTQDAGVTSNFIDVENDTGTSTLINRYKALQVVPLSAAPSPTSALRGTLIMESGTGVDDTPVIQIRKADGSYAWVPLKGAAGTNGIDGLTPGLYPAYPTTGFVEFWVWVLPTGIYLPYFLNAGDTVEVEELSGWWFFNDGTDSYIVSELGTSAVSIGGFPAGALMFTGYIVDGVGKISTTEPQTYFGDGPFVANESDICSLLMNTDSGYTTHGYILAKLKLTRYAGPIYDWTLTYDFRLSSPGFTITAQNGTQDGTYGIESTTNNGAGVSVAVHGGGSDTVLTAIDFTFVCDTLGGNTYLTANAQGDNVFPVTYQPVAEGSAVQTYSATGLTLSLWQFGSVKTPISFGALQNFAQWNPPPATRFGVVQVIIHGSGTPPTF